MEKDWIKVKTTHKLYIAELWKSNLADKGVWSVIINKKDSSYLIGEIELYVKSEDFAQAESILENIE